MKAPGCERIALADLIDYAAGELPEAEAAAIEEHLFSCADCGARAAELDALLRAIRPAVRSAEVGGFVTDAVLNRLAREGVRVRTYALSPGAVVACAVWDDDELMTLRLLLSTEVDEFLLIVFQENGVRAKVFEAQIDGSCLCPCPVHRTRRDGDGLPRFQRQ